MLLAPDTSNPVLWLCYAAAAAAAGAAAAAAAASSSGASLDASGQLLLNGSTCKSFVLMVVCFPGTMNSQVLLPSKNDSHDPPQVLGCMCAS